MVKEVGRDEGSHRCLSRRDRPKARKKSGGEQANGDFQLLECHGCILRNSCNFHSFIQFAPVPLLAQVGFWSKIQRPWWSVDSTGSCPDQAVASRMTCQRA